MSDRKKKRPTPSEMRRSSRGLPPLDLAEVPDYLGSGDARWLWHALGPVLLRRRYVTELDRWAFAMLCTTYEHRNTLLAARAEYRRANDRRSSRLIDEMLSDETQQLDELCADFGIRRRLIRDLEKNKPAAALAPSQR